MSDTIVILLYVALIVFAIWLSYTLVRAVVRISRAMERASSSLAEIARNQASRTNQPS